MDKSPLTSCFRWLVIELVCLSLLGSTLISGAVPARSRNRAQQPSSKTQTSSPSAASENFKFEKADLELLEQVNLLDKRFERDGLVFEDDAANTLLKRMSSVISFSIM